MYNLIFKLSHLYEKQKTLALSGEGFYCFSVADLTLQTAPLF